jgi:hypothetical protein
MSKQTAVEWYEKEINSLFERYEEKEISEREFIRMKHNLFYDAKEVEMQQIMDAVNFGNAFNGWALNHEFKKYYNETYNKDK